ncbi:hypothetical protein DY000_02007186 [Brassica cretica]|uniref:DUF1985 domain-containing protein n=1 Tax=Brassica cretica TaxID=69181 RepID=A0ABQ7BTT8_BRACR|nr:hypothetical protein DY000_02007186 [Brassica cretica]
MISTPVGHARGSSLRKIFNLPACQHPVSSYPLIFGLQEFGTITGLPRGAFPVDYEPVSNKKSEVGKDPHRKKLIGKKKLITIAELCHKLESESQMTWWRKILLKLIIIVDDVFIPHKESSFKTTYFIKPSKLVSWKGNDPIRTLVRQLKQGSLRLHRFPLSLQFLAFHAFKKFQSKIHAPFGQSSIMDFDDIHLPQHRPINLIDILCMEAEPNVECFIELLFKTLPVLVKMAAKPKQTKFCGLQSFALSRRLDLYINSGTCEGRPVIVKFLEIHVDANPALYMFGITDKPFDALCKQYIMNFYKTIVLPSYLASPLA